MAVTIKRFFLFFLAALAVSVLVNVNLTAAMPPPPSADLSVVANAVQLLAPRNLTQQASCPSTQPANQAGW